MKSKYFDVCVAEEIGNGTKHLVKLPCFTHADGGLVKLEDGLARVTSTNCVGSDEPGFFESIMSLEIPEELWMPSEIGWEEEDEDDGNS